MRRVAMGAMALAGLSAYALAAVDECATVDFTATKDYFPAAANTAVEEARKFTIDYFPTYKVVTNLASKRQYVLYPCGATEPNVETLALPVGFQRRTMTVPVQKVITAETVSYDFLTLLDNDVTDMGVSDRLLALSEYSSSACGQKALTCTTNSVLAGVSPKVPGWGAKPEDYTPLMDAVGAYFDYGENYKGTGKDKTVIFSATSETSLLGRGEWLKFVGAFFNLEHTADKKFEETRTLYNALSEEAKTLPNRPKVAFLDIDTYGDPNNHLFTFSVAGYKRSAVLDAGGYINNVEDFVGLTGVSFPTNNRAARWAVPKAAGPDRDAAIAVFLTQLKNVDVVIDERYSATVLDRDQALAAFGLTADDKAYPFIAKGKWFRQDKTGSASGSNWFEQGVSRPELVLKDFVKVLHPEAASVKNYQTVFLRDLFANENKIVKTAADCKTPYPICGLPLAAAAPICPPASFKTCADGSKAFLTASSDCGEYEACPTVAADKGVGIAGIAAIAPVVDECVSDYSATKDYFPAAANTAVEEARKFTIDYFPTYKVVTNLASKRQYVLYSCGAPEPDVAALALPAGFQRRTMTVPVQKVITAETVSYDFLTLLDNDLTDMGVSDRLLALSEYSSSACGQKALTCTTNSVLAGVSPKVPGWGAKPEDYTPLMDAVGAYFDYGENYKGTGKDKTVIFSATSETSLLGRGEWLKFVGAFFNLEHTADKKFEETRAIYNALSVEANALPNRPKVAFLDIDTYGDPNNHLFTFSVAGYKQTAVLDAGGYINNVEDFVGLTGVSFPTNMRAARWAVPKAAGPDRDAAIAVFLAQLKDVDVVIDERYSATVLNRDQALAAFGLTADDKAYPFIAKGKWFRQDKTGSASGSNWFEQGVSRPELVLKDFVKVLHPEAASVKNYQTVFLRDLFAGEHKIVKTAADCKTPYPICGLALEGAAPICPSSAFKTCADGSKAFLTASSGCTKYESCAEDASAASTSAAAAPAGSATEAAPTAALPAAGDAAGTGASAGATTAPAAGATESPAAAAKIGGDAAPVAPPAEGTESAPSTATAGKDTGKSGGLPASSNIILAVFMSCVGLLLMYVGFHYGKKHAAAKNAANDLPISSNGGALH